MISLYPGLADCAGLWDTRPHAVHIAGPALSNGTIPCSRCGLPIVDKDGKLFPYLGVTKPESVYSIPEISGGKK